VEFLTVTRPGDAISVMEWRQVGRNTSYTGTEILYAGDYPSIILGTTFSPKTSQLLVVFLDGRIRAFGLQGKALATAPGTTCIAAALNRPLFVTGNVDGSISIHDIANGATLARRVVHSSPITHVRFSPDDSHVYSGGTDQLVVETYVGSVLGRQSQVYEGHTSEITGIIAGADHIITSGGRTDGTIRAWNRRTGTEMCEPIRMPGDDAYVTQLTGFASAAFQALQRSLVWCTTSAGQVHNVYLAPANVLTPRFAIALLGLPRCILLPRPDSDLVIVGTTDGELCLIDTVKRAEQQRIINLGGISAILPWN
jgi:WD40 repeat protein